MEETKNTALGSANNQNIGGEPSTPNSQTTGGSDTPTPTEPPTPNTPTPPSPTPVSPRTGATIGAKPSDEKTEIDITDPNKIPLSTIAPDKRDDKKVEIIDKDGKVVKTVTVEEFRKITDRLTRLETAANVARLHSFDQANVKLGPSRIRISRYEGKIIIAWKSIRNESWRNPDTGRLQSIQNYRIFLEDGRTFDVANYQDFSDIRYYDQIECESIGKQKGEGGRIIFKLRRRDTGKEFYIDSSFVN